MTSRHPWLREGRFPPVASLPDPVRIWTFLAGHTAKGDLDGVRRDWEHLPDAARNGALEVVLQTHLFAGYPRVINALGTIHAVGIGPGVALEVGTWDDDRERWRAAGQSLCRAIYGPRYDDLRARIAELHPAFDVWMVETGYGRVLSRPGPTARERELCVIAVLAGMDVSPQLTSHVYGAVRVGATAEEIRAVLDHTGAVWGEAAQDQADAVWASIADRLPRPA